jgi:hypothetical protein
MSLVFAIVSGVAAGVNYYFFQENTGSIVTVQIVIQGILLVLSILSLVLYRWRRTRPAPGSFGMRRYFTFGFVICILAFLGCASIFVAMFLGLK